VFKLVSKKSTNHKTGSTYLSIVNSYYDKQTKQSRTATVRSIGYLDELEKEYDDLIAFFTEEVRKMNERNNNEKLPVNLQIVLNESMDSNYNARKNFGYAALSRIYHEI
jgi:hypothetical protein